MKQYGNKLLPEVGYIFKSSGVLTFSLPAGSEYEEIPIDTSKVVVSGDFAFIDGKFAVKINESRPIKARLINKLFTNDDQLAIILNKEKDILSFMNSWREWISGVINIINSVK